MTAAEAVRVAQRAFPGATALYVDPNRGRDWIAEPGLEAYPDAGQEV